MARRKDLTTEQTNVLTMHRRAIKEMYETAENDMKTCQRGQVNLKDCEFDTIKDSEGNVLYIMRHGDDILEVRRLRIVVQGLWSIASESEVVQAIANSTEKLVEAV